MLCTLRHPPLLHRAGLTGRRVSESSRLYLYLAAGTSECPPWLPVLQFFLLLINLFLCRHSYFSFLCFLFLHGTHWSLFLFANTHTSATPQIRTSLLFYSVPHATMLSRATGKIARSGTAPEKPTCTFTVLPEHVAIFIFLAQFLFSSAL